MSVGRRSIGARRTTTGARFRFRRACTILGCDLIGSGSLRTCGLRISKIRLDVLRKIVDPKQFITGNLMGFWNGIDNYDITRPLTFAAWDDYVGSGTSIRRMNGMTHDLTRGFLDRNFW